MTPYCRGVPPEKNKMSATRKGQCGILGFTPIYFELAMLSVSVCD